MDSFTSFPYDEGIEFLLLPENDLYNFSWNDAGAYYESTHISWTMHLVSVTIYSITLLLGTTGNGLVIFFTAFHMKKTVTTLWYLNLALADFIFALSLFSEILYLVLGHWTLGWLLCKLDTVVSFLNMFASVFFLTAISVDRCISVMYPIWSMNHRTLRLASVIAMFIWVMALGLSSPYFSFRDLIYSDDGSAQCSYNFNLDGPNDLKTHCSVVVTEFVIGFLIPFYVILACYGIIVIKLRGKIFGRFGRPFKIIMVVVVAFFFCWFPHHLFSILETLEDESPQMRHVIDIGMPLANGLVCLNSCLNPFLYVFIGPDCRRATWQSFLSAFKGAFSENWTTSSFSSNRNSSSTSRIVDASTV